MLLLKLDLHVTFLHRFSHHLKWVECIIPMVLFTHDVMGCKKDQRCRCRKRAKNVTCKQGLRPIQTQSYRLRLHFRQEGISVECHLPAFDNPCFIVNLSGGAGRVHRGEGGQNWDLVQGVGCNASALCKGWGLGSCTGTPTPMDMDKQTQLKTLPSYAPC